MHSITRARTTSKSSGRNTSSNTSLDSSGYASTSAFHMVSKDSCNSIAIGNVVGSVEQQPSDAVIQNEPGIMVKIEKSSEFCDSSTFNVVTQANFTTSQNTRTVDTDVDAAQLPDTVTHAQTIFGSDDALTLNDCALNDSGGVSTSALTVGSLVSDLVEKSASSTDEHVNYANKESQPRDARQISDVTQVSFSFEAKAADSDDFADDDVIDALHMTAVDALKLDTSDVTADGADDHRPLDAGFAADGDNVCDDAVSDASSVISTATIDYVHDDDLLNGAGSRRGGKTGTREKTGESSTRKNSGNFTRRPLLLGQFYKGKLAKQERACSKITTDFA